MKQTFDLETDDIQGIVASAYSHLSWAAYMLLRVTDPFKVKCWLGARIADVTTAAGKDPQDTHFNIALTWKGLSLLGLAEEKLSSFSLPFQQGMVQEHRFKNPRRLRL